jgi:hypothetical protein
MVTSVKLQNPFEYSWWVYLVFAVLLLAAFVLLICGGVKAAPYLKKEKKIPSVARKVAMTPGLLRALKEQYVSRVQAIIKGYTEGTVSKRDGYQQLSFVIRSFVHEVTGINVENYTISEVKAMGIRKLDILMEEYYVPEFAEDEKARDKDLTKSCNTAMGVIKSWS